VSAAENDVSEGQSHDLSELDEFDAEIDNSNN